MVSKTVDAVLNAEATADNSITAAHGASLDRIQRAQENADKTKSSAVEKAKAVAAEQLTANKKECEIIIMRGEREAQKTVEALERTIAPKKEAAVEKAIEIFKNN